jgi:putative nucleotidyltransferase with HDIG domain
MIKIFLNITLILLTFSACYIQELYLLFWPPQSQKTLLVTVRTRQSFTYDQDKALSLKRKRAIARYASVYNFLPNRVEDSKRQLEALINGFTLYQAPMKKKADQLEKFLLQELNVRLPRAQIIRLLKYRDLKNLMEGIRTVQESILQKKIIENPSSLTGKKTIEIINPASEEATVYAMADISTLEKAQSSMREKIGQLFWQVDNRVLDPLLQISLATLQPNLRYNQLENNKRLADINRQFPTKIIRYQPGDVLVPFKSVLSEEDITLLDTYLKQYDREVYGKALWILFAILFLVIFYNIYTSNMIATGSRILLFVLIINILIMLACLLFTPAPVYFLPFGLLPMLAVSLNHEKITAVGTTLVGALLVSLFAGATFNLMLYFTLGGLTAVLVSSRIQKRWLILGPSLIVGFINAASVTALTVDWQNVFMPVGSSHHSVIQSLTALLSTPLIESICWAFAGGLIAGPLTLILLPLLEIGWQTASSFKLNRYADPQRPLMKKLLANARGTYQHSMAVASLAQSAGEAVGANTLLLMVGAYYHDLGKMANPGYFIENQFNGENPHDILVPRESANLIVDHVRNGMTIGQENGLPKIILDLMLQHHGTHLIEYFYNLATKANPKTAVVEDDYRYPGPKPQSVEAAILMIADAVEAASRSMQEPTKKKFEKMVRLILVKRIVDGQFSECDITTRDLEKIVQALVDSLEATFHSRIRYPWQEKTNPPPKGTWRIDRAAEKDKEDRAFRL